MRYENKIFLIIVGAVAFFYAYIFIFLQSIFLQFLAEFTAGFLGILIGFSIERYRESGKKNQDRKDLLRDLHDELEEIKGKLTGKAFMLYPDIWDSAISSGQIRLLNSEQVTKLAKVYRQIKGTEYEAQWVRRAGEDHRSCDTPLRDKLWRRWNTLSNIQRDREKKLRAEIDELLEEKWWNG